MNWVDLLAPQGMLVRFGACLLLALGLVGFGWVKGAGHVQHQWDAHTAQLEKAHDAEIARLEVVKAKVETRYVERVRLVREAAKVITKEVPVYVTVADDAACRIPAGLVSLLNRAAQGALPVAEPPGGADGTTAVARTAPPSS